MKPITKRRISQRQERDIMSKLGGRVQPASGSLRGHKGDGRVFGVYRVEAKYTTAQTYKLDVRDLWKIAGECEQGEAPLFIIDYKEEGTHRTRGRFVVVPFDYFQKVTGHAIDDDL